MNTQEQEAIKVMKQVIDISIAKGIFQNAESVVNVYNAYSIIQKVIEAHEEAKVPQKAAPFSE